MEEGRRFTQRYLDPADRLGEVLFGLIMVLTVTLTADLTLHDGRASARELMVAAIGCNVAWGIIDGGMYVMAALLERARRAKALLAVQRAPDEAAGLAVVAEVLDDTLIGLQPAEDRQRAYAKVREMALRTEPGPVRIVRDDLIGALACFLLVVLSLVPAILPFLFIDEARTALRWSNGLLVASLFGTGFAWGHHAGANRWLTGGVFMAVGLALVGIAIALGG